MAVVIPVRGDILQVGEKKVVLIIRDYYMAFWLSPDLSTHDPIIIPRPLVRGLIMVKG